MRARKMTPEEIDARMKAVKREAEAVLKSTRAELLRKLRVAGIGLIEAQYDGYSDSGNVHEISGGMEDDPGSLSGTGLEEAVSSFVWDFAYGRHCGFENGEGGQGTLTWDIAADSITLRHEDNYIEVDVTLEEDL